MIPLFFIAAFFIAPTVYAAINAPSDLTATAINETQIDLSWTDNSPNEDGFSIERSTDGVIFAEIDTVGTDVTTYSDTGLTRGTTYYYRVRAFKQQGPTTNYSDFSNTANDTTPIQMTGSYEGLAKPTGSVVVSLTPSSTSSPNIVFDASRTKSCESNCDTNINWSHSVTGTDRGILVFLQGPDTSCGYKVQYDNTDMTLVAESDIYDSIFRTWVYKQDNPAASATGVSVSTSNSCGWSAGSVSYTGVDTDMISTTSSNTNPAGSLASVTTTPAISGEVIVSGHGAGIAEGIPWDPGSGQTERVDYSAGNRSIFITDLFALSPDRPLYHNWERATCVSNCTDNTNWDHAVSGDDRGILVFINGSEAFCDWKVLFDNTDMTLVAKSGFFDSIFRTWVYKTENPSLSATGVSVSANCGWSAISISYTGVDQTDMISTSATGTNPVGSLASVTTTTEIANALVVSGHGQESGTITWTPGSEQNDRADYSASNRAINVTERFIPYSSTQVQMTANPSDLSQETGSVVVSLRSSHAPSDLTATAINETQIDLSWTDNTSHEVDFRIERGTDGVSFVEIDTVGENVTTYSDTGLTRGTTYYYRVRVIYTGYSNTANDTTPIQMTGEYEGLAKPTGSVVVSLTPASPSSPSITFDASGTGSGSSGTVNWPHSVTGTDLGILVFLQGPDDTSCGFNVQHGNTDMTLVAKSDIYDSIHRTWVWEMENPDPSATGVSVSTSISCDWSAGSVSYTGVDQTDMISTTSTATGPAQVVASVTTTPAISGEVIVSGHGIAASGITWDPGSGQTERVDYYNNVRSIFITDLFAGSPDKPSYDNWERATCVSDCGSTEFSHSVAGTDRGLLVFIQGPDSGGICAFKAYYDDVLMTSVATSSIYDSNFRTYVFKQENPPIGATTVKVTTGGCGWSAVSISYTNVDQTDMISTTSSNTNPVGSLASVTTTTEVANAMVVSGHGQESSTISWTPGSEQNERADYSAGNRSINVTERPVPYSSTQVQMTANPSDLSQETGSVVVSLKPAS